jgi:hypothetical protein
MVFALYLIAFLLAVLILVQSPFLRKAATWAFWAIVALLLSLLALIIAGGIAAGIVAGLAALLQAARGGHFGENVLLVVIPLGFIAAFCHALVQQRALRAKRRARRSTAARASPQSS